MILLHRLESKETAIVEELNNAQGKAENIEGYYFPNESATLRLRLSTKQNLKYYYRQHIS